MNDSTGTGLLRKPFGDVQRDAAVQDLSRSLGVVPVLAIVFCILMVLPLIIDIVGKAMHGNAIPAFLLGGYCALGALVYLGYGRRHSKLRGART